MSQTGEREKAWLIESKTACGQPNYIRISDAGIEWVLDHNLATRFSRKIDARNVADWIDLEGTFGEIEPVEHWWTE